jgi:hypothetical protein
MARDMLSDAMSEGLHATIASRLAMHVKETEKIVNRENGAQRVAGYR